MRWIKRFFWRLYHWPIKPEDLKCPIRIFARDDYMSRYGVIILRSELAGNKWAEDDVVWLSLPQLNLWPEDMRKASSIEILQRHR